MDAEQPGAARPPGPPPADSLLLRRHRSRFRQAPDGQSDETSRQPADGEIELLRRLIDTIPVMVTVYDPAIREMRVNRAFEEILGWTNEDLARDDVMRLCYPDPEYREKVRTFMQSPDGRWRDFTLTAKDGRRVESTWANIRLGDERQVGIGVDITERKRAEDALRETRDLLSLATRASRLGWGTWDASSGAVEWDARAREILGVESEGSLAFEEWVELIHPDDRTAVEAQVRRCVAERRPFEIEYRVVRGDGSVVHVQSTGAFEVSSDGRAVRGSGLLRDITAQKETERALREAKEAAEQANIAKSEFVAVVSHDLRTPLQSVVGFADLLLLGTQGPLTDGQRRHVEKIQGSARHQLTLIEELLTYVRIESGHESLRPAPTDVGEALRAAAEFVRPEADRKGLDLRVDVEGDPLEIVTDPGKLRQIALNLVGNAVKFTVEGAVTMSAAADGEGVVVRVRDTGPGIPEAMREAIFEPFTRVRGTAAVEDEGTGLGLAIVRRLVDFVGGRVTVESRVGEGSTFVVILPGTAAPDA